jgi:hypothetical protein
MVSGGESVLSLSQVYLLGITPPFVNAELVRVSTVEGRGVGGGLSLPPIHKSVPSAPRIRAKISINFIRIF